MWARRFSASSTPNKHRHVETECSSFSSSPLIGGCDKLDVGDTTSLMDRSDSQKLPVSGSDGDSEPLAHTFLSFLWETVMNYRRDLVMFSLGSLAGTVLFFCTSYLSLRNGVDTLLPCDSGLDDLSTLLTPPNKTLGHRYAFVQMAYDAPGTPLKHIWQVLAMARALQRFSAFPLLVLTNTTHLPDGTPLANVLGRLNAKMLPVQALEAPEDVRPYMTAADRIKYWMIQIWRLTEFEKLIWLDADAIIVRSLDWLFERTPTWGQKDNWMCRGSDAEEWLSSGLMLIEPREETFRGLQRFAATRSLQWWTRGIHELIRMYFLNVVKRPVRLLDVADASYGKCLGRLPNIPYESPGPWNIPAFVHKSSWNNVCFYFDMDRQQADIHGQVVNICNFHPLGPFWRDLFCDAVKTIGAKTNATEVFCDDYLWYKKA
mmetsp:Transcript_86238/g.239108  ORF Transcript_86238/g.239108 Transcript_86238/m.239108 type:complete len:431 (+) Transcript_86238:108-1400(+)